MDRISASLTKDGAAVGVGHTGLKRSHDSEILILRCFGSGMIWFSSCLVLNGFDSDLTVSVVIL